MNRRHFVFALPALALAARPAAASSSRLGLIFVGQSTCPYCAAIAPVLSRMNDAGHVDLMLASMDRRPIPPIYGFEDGLAHPLTRRVRTVPQVMIYHPELDQVTHVVGGVRNMRHFVRRLSQALREASSL